jgi:hypothetical protein
MLLVLLLFHGFSRPHFDVRFVTSFSELPRPGRIIRMPGVEPNGVICVAADRESVSPRKLDQPDNYTSILDKYLNIIPQPFIRQTDIFTVSYKGNSTYNKISLGHFDPFIRNGSELSAVTTGGDPCGNSTYQLQAKLYCDKSLKNPHTVVETVVFDTPGGCNLTAIVRMKAICKIPGMAADIKPFHRIACIDAAAYEAGLDTL